jgi:hypothetical protein
MCQTFPYFSGFLSVNRQSSVNFLGHTHAHPQTNPHDDILTHPQTHLHKLPEEQFLRLRISPIYGPKYVREDG